MSQNASHERYGIRTYKYPLTCMESGCASTSSDNAVSASSRTSASLLIDGYVLPSEDDAVCACASAATGLLVGGSIGGNGVDSEQFSDGVERVHG